jgi:hypothetical protein
MNLPSLLSELMKVILAPLFHPILDHSHDAHGHNNNSVKVRHYMIKKDEKPIIPTSFNIFSECRKFCCFSRFFSFEGGHLVHNFLAVSGSLHISDSTHILPHIITGAVVYILV